MKTKETKQTHVKRGTHVRRAGRVTTPGPIDFYHIFDPNF